MGATITVALDSDLAGIAPIYRGSLQPIGQIGSLVRLPQGIVDLLATVTLVGIAELAGPVQPTESVQRDDRWLQVQLLGEIDRATKQFQRGVGTYPGLDDPVHFATPDQLVAVFPDANEEYLRIGRLAASEDVAVCLNAAKTVIRHCAVVGSTGSGKTSTVVSLLQGFVKGGWQSANIIVIDPHGEYARALRGSASIRSVLGEANERLLVPYWALPASDILKIFTRTALIGATALNRFVELVTLERQKFAQGATAWLDVSPDAITSDTPIPFDIRHVWHQLDSENRETRKVKGDPATASRLDQGDAATLRSAKFEVYGPNSTPPHQAPTYNAYGTVPELLRLGLLEPQLRFFREPIGTSEGPDPLVNVVQQWLGGISPVSVLDFSGVPSSAADVAVGVILNLIMELAFHTDNEGPGIGRPSPVLVVLEEAHRFLSDGANALTRESANRIAREGRKYGVGIMLVTQRPKELPDTALAQCGTLIALRLSNTEDQGVIRSALPDTVAGLASVLPSLRTGEAIISGEGIVLPVRAILDKPEPPPRADDPLLSGWRMKPHLPCVAPALKAWRGTFEEN